MYGPDSSFWSRWWWWRHLVVMTGTSGRLKIMVLEWSDSFIRKSAKNNLELFAQQLWELSGWEVITSISLSMLFNIYVKSLEERGCIPRWSFCPQERYVLRMPVTLVILGVGCQQYADAIHLNNFFKVWNFLSLSLFFLGEGLLKKPTDLV